MLRGQQAITPAHFPTVYFKNRAFGKRFQNRLQKCTLIVGVEKSAKSIF